MSKVSISYRILPSDVNIDLDIIKRKMEKKIPKYASIYKFDEEPIAYGLVALIAHIICEEKSGEDESGLDEIEKRFRLIDEISEIETLMIRRV